MKHLILITCYHFFVTCCYAQVNLVINPSFEDTLQCPFMAGQIDYTGNWHTPIMGGGGDPDLHHSCSPSTCYCGVPVGNGNGYQFPKSGSAFVGLMAYYGTNNREYIQGMLLDTLKSNTIYCVSFYVNLRNNSKYYCNSIGAYLDKGTVNAPSAFGLAQATPQVYNTTQQLIDTLNWIKIEGSFTANGTETHITLGNFLDDASSDKGIFSSINPTPYAYYNIADVSVIDISTPAYAGNDTVIHPGDSVFLGRQPEVGLNEACVWYVNGTPTDTTAGLWVTPDTTTTYILQQTLCGNVSYDTVKVTMDFDVGIVSLNANYRQGVRLYPNPTTKTITIEITNKQHQLQSIILYDITGKSQLSLLEEGVRLLSAEAGGVIINIKELPQSIYFCNITLTNGQTHTRKIIKQ